MDWTRMNEAGYWYMGGAAAPASWQQRVLMS